jgi:hypothetical protein
MTNREKAMKARRENAMNAKALRAADRQYRDRTRAARVVQAQALADSSVAARRASLDARIAAAAPGHARAAAAAAVVARRQTETTAARASKTPKK